MVVLNLFQIGHCVLNISLQWTTLLNAVFIFYKQHLTHNLFLERI